MIWEDLYASSIVKGLNIMSIYTNLNPENIRRISAIFKTIHSALVSNLT